MADGMYESYVHSVASGPDGSLWVTHGRNIPSVTQMDGYGSRQIAMEKGKVRPFDRLFGEPGAWAWGLTLQGFRVLDPAGAWTNRPLPPLDGSVAAKPLDIGKALVLKPGQLLEYDFSHNTTKLLWQRDRSPIGRFSEMAGDLEHGLWIAGEFGVGRLRSPSNTNQSWEWVEFRQWPEPMGQFRSLATGAGDEVFATASASHGTSVLMRYDGRSWESIYRTDQAKSAAWRGADDVVWIKDGDTLYSQQEDRLQKIEPTAVQSDSITDVKADPGGAFWLATHDGLLRNAPQLWRTPVGARGIESSVYGIDDDGTGGLWFITANDLIHFSGAKREIIPVPKRWARLVLRSVSPLVLRDGSLVAPSGGHRLVHVDPRTHEFREILPPEGTSLEAITPRGDGTAWVATRIGTGPQIELSIFDGEFHQPQTPPLEWGSGGVLAIRQTSDGDIWIGGTNQLHVFQNGQLRQIGRDAGYTDSGAYTITEVQPGKLWVGGRSKIMEFDGKNWTVLREADRTRLILPTRDGSVWVAASDGVYRFQNGTWLDYGLQEGLPSSIAFCVHEDQRNRIWVGTTQGLSVYHPEADLDPPVAYIVPSQNPAKVSRGEVRLLFSGTDKWRYTAADRLLFSYRIDGRPWSAFAPSAPAVYPFLETGRHHFEVRAMDRAGNSSLQPASFDFSVVPPWYLTQGFLWSVRIGASLITFLLVLLGVSYTNRGRLIAQLTHATAEAGRQREQAERANRSKSQFLANMSHEIRTPMNGVLGMAELARQADTGEERQECLRVVEHSARSLLAILNDILDFSKIEAEKVDLACEPFYLRQCLMEALQPMTASAGEKGLELVMRIAPDVPDLVVGDSVRLRQVLVNLLGNSVKFTEAGEVVLDLAVAEAGADFVVVRFEIHDTGIGIPPEKQQLIFQPFEQADGSTTRRFGGTGLGLAISARLVQMMGGTIEVESPWNHGVSAGGPGTQFGFSIKLSRHVDPMQSLETPGEAHRLPDVPILIVEGNATSRDVLAEILDRAGMRVATAANGLDAMQKLESASLAANLFDVVIIDRSLPDTDGWDLAAGIRLTLHHHRARLILLNTPGRQTKIAVPNRVAIDGFLSKPVEEESLVQTVAAALNTDSTTLQQNGTALAAEPLPQSRLRILVAEDNSINQMVARRLLEKRGHSVQIAADGLQAVASQQCEAFDLILMDLEMPEMDGYTATAEIRRQEGESGRRRSQIFALTAHAMKGEMERCLAAGMDGFLTKPIEIAELNALLQRTELANLGAALTE